MDILQTLINTGGVIVIIGLIRVLILRPDNLFDIVLKLTFLDLIGKIVDEIDFDDWDDFK